MKNESEVFTGCKVSGMVVTGGANEKIGGVSWTS